MPPSRLRPRKTPVQARALETRSRILDAAARVFSVHGYAAGTTNRIAAEAGLSIGSLYQYFPNKDAILVTLVRAHVTEGTEAVLAAVEQARHLPAEDLTGRVRAIVDAVVGVHAGDPGLHQVLFEEAPRPPELLDELRALEDVAVRVAADLIAARPPADLTHDDEMTARMVVTTIESLVHRLVATRQPRVAVDDVRREVTAVVVRYLVG
jgi:AcrR family transcriptional regulator